jgi:hypothetical protein
MLHLLNYRFFEKETEAKTRGEGGGLSWQKRSKENSGKGRAEITTFYSEETDFNWNTS